MKRREPPLPRMLHHHRIIIVLVLCLVGEFQILLSICALYKRDQHPGGLKKRETK
ncbi:hypothetical protein FA13DRAFT_1739781 [Coprinellus micaceus]|uniref:Uncharacterized protein n=1 Tax=Coprinellus micaceus TaxID=71717 RepID=A0A4Y7SPS6_COPMI|nr:hypothetical protein FA13DRAFT_1739781 [Coprinellus micaceus]